MQRDGGRDPRLPAKFGKLRVGFNAYRVVAKRNQVNTRSLPLNESKSSGAGATRRMRRIAAIIH
jgi:hypothetical protein